VAENKPNELKLTRVYDAPLAAIWDAWTNAQQTAQWWGPRGFSLTTHNRDLQVGGRWRFTMHGPDGVDYPNVVRYLEVKSQRCLVYDHSSSDETPPLFCVTVLFRETPSGTQMDMTMTLPTPEAAEQTRKFVKRAGGESTWDRLGEFLMQRSSGKSYFVINRSFPTSREKMFQMWTQPEHFSRWLPPTGAEMSPIRADIRPGGSAFYVMTSSDGLKMHGLVQYRELQQPERIVYTQQFCDDQERPSRHPMAPTWPETMTTVVMLSDERPEQTRVTLTWEPDSTSNPEEIDAFVNGRSGMAQGWTGSFDKLEMMLLSAF
jgi:uncharacterized protein YndB with AHSA1/START domain